MPNRILYYSNIVKAEWNAKSLLDLHSRGASYIIQIYRKVRAEQSSLLEIVMPNRICIIQIYRKPSGMQRACSICIPEAHPVLFKYSER